MKTKDETTQTEQLIPDGSTLVELPKGSMVVPIDEYAAIVADAKAATEAATTLRCHVYASPESANPRAPLYRVEAELTGPLAGVVMECPVFAERDARTGRVVDFSVTMPGGKFQSVKPLPIFVEGKDGKRYPVSRSEDATGRQSVVNWQAGIKTAVKQFAITGEPFQIVKL